MLDLGMIVLIGLIGGVAVGMQAPIAGAMGQRIGGTAGSFFVHLSGMILSGALLILRGGEKIRDWQTLPWYMLGAGIFGVILYQTINITLPRLGSTMTVALIIVGQLLVGIVIDHFGWLDVPAHPVDAARILGVVALLTGSYLIAK
ncbi:MAG: DMT family transporter [Chloroflexi bacterium]|nr:DMT family transporter [Chloroflexota bacterium]